MPAYIFLFLSDDLESAVYFYITEILQLSNPIILGDLSDIPKEINAGSGPIILITQREIITNLDYIGSSLFQLIQETSNGGIIILPDVKFVTFKTGKKRDLIITYPIIETKVREGIELIKLEWEASKCIILMTG